MTDIRPLVVVTSSFPIRSDGSEAAGSFVADFVAELAKEIPVRVVAPGTATASERWSERVTVFRYAAPARPLSTLKAWNPLDMPSILRVLRSGSAATRAALGDDAGHVLALWGLPCGEWARRAAVVRGVGYSVWLLGSDVWTLGRLPLLRSILRRVMRQARHVYADGYLLADEATRIGGVPIDFLPSTRSVERLAPLPTRSTPPFRLLFLGRWHPNKGVDLLLDALEILDDADFVRIESIAIEGGGPLEPIVRERVERLRGRGRPVFMGTFLSKSEAKRAIEMADWVLIPSRIESIPIVFSDAMKLRRPVIATPVGDLPRLMNGRACGVVCSRADAPAFAAGLRIALHDTRVDEADLSSLAAIFSLDAIAGRILRDLDGQ